MIKFPIFIAFILLAISPKEKKIVAIYSAISCPCAQWKVKGEKENIYLVRENNKIQDVNEIWDGETLPFKVVLTGRFRIKKGVPEFFSAKGDAKPAKIFVYSQFKVLKK